MTILTGVLLVTVGLLLAFAYFQRQTLLHELEEARRSRFVCYYCQHSFGAESLERVGKYDYCKQHGLERQKALNV